MRTVEENIKAAQLLFPDVDESVEDILKKYPRREVEDDQLVLRFAPSPTGFVHIGSIYTALINEKLVRQSNGVFILRVEDTDKKREIENGVDVLIDGIKAFDIEIDEGVAGDGKYGPYLQSERGDIYRVFAKDLVSKGLAYPCFASSNELEEIRAKQTAMGVRTGYYGEFAKWRDASLENVQQELEKGTPFVIRLYSQGINERKINVVDLIKGGITLSENDMDAVLLKSDGLPTYHFAHPIDDYLMDISFVLRGDEWLPSQPLHMEIFKALGFDILSYGHISPLMKLEGGNKRKLSKRKDPEADIAYYIEKGYPINAVKEYLLNIANSNFYDWRMQNPHKDISEFELRLEKFNRAGALFDIRKLEDICKEYISKLSATVVYEQALKWAQIYDKEIFERLNENKDYCINIFNIEREGSKVRKDLIRWSDIPEMLEMFFDDYSIEEVDMDSDLQKTILEEYLNTLYIGDSLEEWFAKIMEIASRNGFALDFKEYEKDSGKYKGKVGDVAMVIRVAITGKKQTPDLYQVIQVMGEQKVRERIQRYIKSL